MKRAGRFRNALIVGSAVASVLVALSACSQQGEGDRCDFDNGDIDCASGLICLPATNQNGRGAGTGTVNPPYNNSDRCCPPDRTQATHPACTVPKSPVAGDSGTPADSGPTPDATVTDSAADSPSDAASDAADDAADAADGD
jgi:hypothetical protein